MIWNGLPVSLPGFHLVVVKWSAFELCFMMGVHVLKRGLKLEETSKALNDFFVKRLLLLHLLKLAILYGSKKFAVMKEPMLQF
jgi:hypothetical protein